MIELTWPWILLLLPLPWIVWRFVPPTSSSFYSTILQVPFLNEIESCLTQQKKTESLHSFWKNKHCWFAFIVWIFLLIAASDPRWVWNPQFVPQSGRDLMLAVDLSSSMSIPDMVIDHKQVPRISAIKVVANQFISQRKGDRIGLILFGSKAYLQTPLTYDRSTVKAMLDDTSIGLAGNLTAMGDAIGLAIKHLSQSNLQNRVLVLISDGSNNSGNIEPLEAAQMAAKQNIRIYTIGVGSEDNPLLNLFRSQQGSQPDELDVKTLQAIAKLTGGLFFRANDSANLQRAYQQLDKIEPVKSGQIIYATNIMLYPWFLSAALLLVLIKMVLRLRKVNVQQVML